AQAPAAWAGNRGAVLLLRATAYLRMAEEQNCCRAGNKDSCLMPIRGEGIHKSREGATRAIEVLGELLESEPQNLKARFMLNVAHMTLGGYPARVPRALVIPP